MYDDIKDVPKELCQRDKIQEALIFISEQNISTGAKVGLLIRLCQSINKIFTPDEIDFALTDHED